MLNIFILYSVTVQVQKALQVIVFCCYWHFIYFLFLYWLFSNWPCSNESYFTNISKQKTNCQASQSQQQCVWKDVKDNTIHTSNCHHSWQTFPPLWPPEIVSEAVNTVCICIDERKSPICVCIYALRELPPLIVKKRHTLWVSLRQRKKRVKRRCLLLWCKEKDK